MNGVHRWTTYRRLAAVCAWLGCLAMGPPPPPVLKGTDDTTQQAVAGVMAPAKSCTGTSSGAYAGVLAPLGGRGEEVEGLISQTDGCNPFPQQASLRDMDHAYVRRSTVEKLFCGPSWNYIGYHSLNAATASNSELVRLHGDGMLCRYNHGGPSDPVVLIRRNGHIRRYDGTSWQLIDDNFDSVEVAATRDNIYQRHRDGKVWRWNGGFRLWTLIDDYLDTGKRLSAGPVVLYQIRSNGHIYQYSTVEPGGSWKLVDSNPNSVKIAAGGAGLFQMHRTTHWVYGYAGSPSVWDIVDKNVLSENITVGSDTIYQIHKDGTIWRWYGPNWNNWAKIDDNPASVRIVARGDRIFQRHSNGNVWRWIGGFRRWEPLGGAGVGSVEIYGSVGTVESGDGVDRDGDGQIDRGVTDSDGDLQQSEGKASRAGLFDASNRPSSSNRDSQSGDRASAGGCRRGWSERGMREMKREASSSRPERSHSLAAERASTCGSFGRSRRDLSPRETLIRGSDTVSEAQHR